MCGVVIEIHISHGNQGDAKNGVPTKTLLCNVFDIESGRSIFFSGDGLKAHMDYERVDVERIQEKYELRFLLSYTIRDAGEWGNLWELDEALFAQIQLWSADTMGYIISIARGSYLKEQGDFWKERAIESVIGLRRNDIFHDDVFCDWYKLNIEHYPHIKAYIELVDHMRLMGINYIETYVFPRYNINLPLE
jgi:hypothetical protein